MDAQRQHGVVDEIAVALGARRAWRLVILSAIGLVLLLGVAGILVGVYLDGAASLDDIGLPAVFVGVLLPVLGLGLLAGIANVRDVSRHELLAALRAQPPAVAHVERVEDGPWTGVRFHLPSGAQHLVWLEPRTVDEIGRWLGR